MSDKRVMMFCTKCGEQYEAEADSEHSFCTYCGTQNRTIKKKENRDEQNQSEESHQKKWNAQFDAGQAYRTNSDSSESRNTSDGKYYAAIKEQIHSLTGNLESLNLNQLYSVKKKLEQISTNKRVAKSSILLNFITDSIFEVNEVILKKEEESRKVQARRAELERISAEKKQKKRAERKAKIAKYLEQHNNKYIRFDQKSKTIVFSKYFWKGIIALVLILVVIIAACISIGIYNKDRYDWNDVVLNAIIPKPELPKGEITRNNQSSLDMTLFHASSKDFDEYMQKCLYYGFINDPTTSEFTYDAFNEEGYYVSLSLTSSSNEIQISLSGPKVYGELVWPDNQYASLVPVPKSSVGEIYETENYLSLLIGDMSLEDYNEYVKECIEKGFHENQNVNEKNFSAQNAEGFTVTANYAPFRTVLIEVKEPMHPAAVTIHCRQNWLLNTYDLSCYLNGDFIGIISHGEERTFDLEVKEGQNLLVIYSYDDFDIKGEYRFIGKTQKDFNFEARCRTTSIDIDSEDPSVTVAETTAPLGPSEDFDLDYVDCVPFEKALNDGLKVNGKIVQFRINSYEPESSLGINCWAGEHLNFISEEQLDVDAGDVIIGRITEEPWKFLHSWVINYEVLAINGTKVVSKKEEPSSSDAQASEITLTMGSDDFKGMEYTEAEDNLREMGFTKFLYQTVETEKESKEDTIKKIVITESSSDSSKFSKGDKFSEDAEITLFYYKYKKPARLSYSSNDRETAKEGNSGVFSYIKKGSSYDIYWIIDFDKGYAYYFTEGNGDSTCERVKIESGTLNDAVVVTYHEGGVTWSYYLHFKYVEHPETLIVVDNDNFEWKFSTTNLSAALKIRDTKDMKDY